MLVRYREPPAILARPSRPFADTFAEIYLVLAGHATFTVDGEEITGFQYGGGGNYGVTNRLQTFLLDPGTTTSHTVTARVETAGAGTTCGAVIDSVRINVAAMS